MKLVIIIIYLGYPDIIKKNLKTIINENFENQSENDIEKIINYICYNFNQEDEKNSNSYSSQSDIEENSDYDNNLKLKQNLDEDILDDNKDDSNLNNNDINLEKNLENKSFSLEIDVLEFDEKINIINKSENDYIKLINLFGEININEEGNDNNWFKIPLKVRINIISNKNKKNDIKN